MDRAEWARRVDGRPERELRRRGGRAGERDALLVAPQQGVAKRIGVKGRVVT